MDALGAGWAAWWADMESRVTHERGLDGWGTLLLDMGSDATHERAGSTGGPLYC